DRPPNECQRLVEFPHQVHPEGNQVKCTYIEIPQVRETYAVLGSQPYWLWGFEHGINERGVVIGNEAVWSKEPPAAEPALLGMDLLRLGLERGGTAQESLQVITELLEKYGQGGSCVAEGEFYYHNSFLIADPKEAWVLETSARHWVARRVRSVAAISNIYSIEHEWDEASPDLVEFAVRQGWATPREEFNFARAYAYLGEDAFAGCETRYNRTQEWLVRHQGRVSVAGLMGLLRDHYEGTVLQPRFGPPNSLLMTVCMHARKPKDSETAASWVAELHPERSGPLQATCWTAFSSPCVSVYQPVYLGAGLPPEAEAGDQHYTPDSAWWAFERLQRQVDRHYEYYAPIVQETWSGIEEREFLEAARREKEALAHWAAGPKEEAVGVLRDFQAKWLQRNRQQAERLTEYLGQLGRTVPPPADIRLPYSAAINEAAGLKLDV
ncbi:MAG TPA: hypothetical protein GX511_00710, partial [Firmicutes bacterium]|nr:hypothetical protein [Bacillota bacterium]